MTHTFNGEPVPDEKWKWVAKYHDGTQLKQFDDHGRFHQLKEVETDKLKFWVITDGSREISLTMSAELTPIHFYRRTQSHDMGSGQKKKSTVHCFGYEHRDTKQKFVHMIYENDQVVTTSNPDSVLDVGYLKDRK